MPVPTVLSVEQLLMTSKETPEMNDKEQHEHLAARAGSPAPVRYEIRVQGRFEERWAAWFDGLTLSAQPDGTTLIAGPITDQAMLHGVLQKLRDLGITLVSAQSICPD